MMSNSSEHLSTEVIVFNSRKMQHQRLILVSEIPVSGIPMTDTTLLFRSVLFILSKTCHEHICNVLHRTHIIDIF